jgi:hypothetical protein
MAGVGHELTFMKVSIVENNLAVACVDKLQLLNIITDNQISLHTPKQPSSRINLNVICEVI